MKYVILAMLLFLNSCCGEEKDVVKALKVGQCIQAITGKKTYKIEVIGEHSYGLAELVDHKWESGRAAPQKDFLNRFNLEFIDCPDELFGKKKNKKRWK